jgi:hypothetical protein
MIAKRATMKDVKIKVLIWGEPGSGKSRFALTFPKPLVIDLEKSTAWYAKEFYFYKAEIDKSRKETKNATILTKTIIDEIISGEYRGEIETLIIDPITDLLDNIETLCISDYEKMINKKVSELNQLEKTKWYAFRRDKTREMLDMIIQLPVNIVWVARSKNMWDKKDGKMQPIGKTFDGLDIIEFLPDLVIHLKEDSIIVKKSRIGKIENIEEKTWDGIMKAVVDGKNKEIIKEDEFKFKKFISSKDEVNKMIENKMEAS